MPYIYSDGTHSATSDIGQFDPDSYSSGPFTERLETIVFHPHDPVLFAVRGNGQICSSTSGWEATKLYSHSEHVHVTQLHWDASRNMLVSTDMDGMVIGGQLEQRDGKWVASRQGKLKIRTKSIIRQLLFNHDGNMFLVSGEPGIAVRTRLDGEGKPKAIRATIHLLDSDENGSRTLMIPRSSSSLSMPNSDCTNGIQ